MSGAGETVNTLMLWLNQTYAVSLPTLADGLSGLVSRLWQIPIAWIRGQSLPATIALAENWDVPGPDGKALFTFTAISIEIGMRPQRA